MGCRDGRTSGIILDFLLSLVLVFLHSGSVWDFGNFVRDRQRNPRNYLPCGSCANRQARARIFMSRVSLRHAQSMCCQQWRDVDNGLKRHACRDIAESHGRPPCKRCDRIFGAHRVTFIFHETPVAKRFKATVSDRRELRISVVFVFFWVPANQN